MIILCDKRLTGSHIAIKKSKNNINFEVKSNYIMTKSDAYEEWPWGQDAILNCVFVGKMLLHHIIVCLAVVTSSSSVGLVVKE